MENQDFDINNDLKNLNIEIPEGYPCQRISQVENQPKNEDLIPLSMIHPMENDTGFISYIEICLPFFQSVNPELMEYLEKNEKDIRDILLISPKKSVIYILA